MGIQIGTPRVLKASATDDAMFNCPRCYSPVSEVSGIGRTEALCGRCQFKYRILTGKLVGRISRQRAIQRQTTRQSGIYERNYELRLDTGRSTPEVVKFSIDGKEDRITVKRGDRVSVVWTMREFHVEDLVRVLNHTTGGAYSISQPGAKGEERAASAGCGWGFAGCFGSFVLLFVVGTGFLSFLLAPAIGIAVMALLRERLREEHAPKHAIGPQRARELGARRELLQRKQELQNDIASLRSDLAVKRQLQDRLEALRTKMASVGSDLYATRLENMARAKAILAEQTAVEQQLLDGYEKAMLMIEIELESGLTEEAVSKDALVEIEQRYQELEGVKEQNDDLRHLLEANEEIERLLRSDTL